MRWWLLQNPFRTLPQPRCRIVRLVGSPLPPAGTGSEAFTYPSLPVSEVQRLPPAAPPPALAAQPTGALPDAAAVAAPSWTKGGLGFRASQPPGASGQGTVPRPQLSPQEPPQQPPVQEQQQPRQPTPPQQPPPMFQQPLPRPQPVQGQHQPRLGEQLPAAGTPQPPPHQQQWPRRSQLQDMLDMRHSAPATPGTCDSILPPDIAAALDAVDRQEARKRQHGSQPGRASCSQDGQHAMPGSSLGSLAGQPHSDVPGSQPQSGGGGSSQRRRRSSSQGDLPLMGPPAIQPSSAAAGNAAPNGSAPRTASSSQAPAMAPQLNSFPSRQASPAPPPACLRSSASQPPGGMRGANGSSAQQPQQAVLRQSGSQRPPGMAAVLNGSLVEPLAAPAQPQSSVSPTELPGCVSRLEPARNCRRPAPTYSRLLYVYAYMIYRAYLMNNVKLTHHDRWGICIMQAPPPEQDHHRRCRQPGRGCWRR